MRLTAEAEEFTHPGDRRLRRASCVIAFWEGDQFAVENYLSGKQTTMAPVVAHLLQALDDYLPYHELVARWVAVPQAEQLIAPLVDQDVLLVEDSPLDLRDRLIDTTWEWGHSARYFHFKTQDVPYEPDLTVQRASLVQHVQTVPAPSPYKEYGHLDVQLAGSFADQGSEFWDVLNARRTRRAFAREPISLQDLSTILLWTWGQTQVITSRELGPYILKTSPSGGARHPIEVYPVVLRVTGVEPGIYHYSVHHHALACLRTGLFEDLVVRLCADQPWFRDAAAMFFMTAVIGRSMWKYKHPHAYRVLLLDAGHVGQTFHLVCTRLGLAPFTTSAKHDVSIERELGLDGISEISIYAGATGIPADESR
ncbi:MAG: SagB/ThcOx family dehydrogenase [Chloroflexota bacterium]|nr:SagB/ThcOx family dehydrogenase [Chloroflexota bacterium]